MDNEGSLKKVWVEMELPHTSHFCYWEDGALSHLKFMVELRANFTSGGSASDFFSIFTSTRVVMDYMKGQLSQLVICCSFSLREECMLCGWNTEDIKNYFKQGGATFREIEVHDSLPLINHDCICDSEFDSHFTYNAGNDYLVENFSGITSFTLDSIQIQISELVDSLAWLGSIYATNGRSFYAVIIDDFMFCGGEGNGPPIGFRGSGSINIDVVKDKYRQHDIGILIHIVAKQSGGYSMVYQTKGIGGNVMLDCSIFPHYCPQFNWVFNRLRLPILT